MRTATQRLAAAGVDVPEREARELVRHALGVTLRAFFLLDPGAPLGPAAEERLSALLTRREGHEPLQYLLTTVPFCDLELEVGPGVLIPRPETEVLVERLHAWLGELGLGDVGRTPAGSGLASPAPWIVDVGTGSGAILLALLARLSDWWGVGVDLSAEALAYARRNLARAEDLGPRVRFVEGDLLAPLLRDPPDGPVLCLVSNPPYVRSAEVAGLAPEVRDHEPRLALDGGEDGLELVRRIVEEAEPVLAPGGVLAFELAPDQPGTVAELLHGRGYTILESYEDLAGRPRGVIARRR